MRIFELDKNKKQILLDKKLGVKETIILENIEGEIFGTIYRKLNEINYNRFEKCKREVNTIAMSSSLYAYLKYLADNKQMYFDDSIRRNIKQIFGLNIVIRDDYEIDQVDFYRDVTKEY